MKNEEHTKELFDLQTKLNTVTRQTLDIFSGYMAQLDKRLSVLEANNKEEK